MLIFFTAGEVCVMSLVSQSHHRIMFYNRQRTAVFTLQPRLCICVYSDGTSGMIEAPPDQNYPLRFESDMDFL